MSRALLLLLVATTNLLQKPGDTAPLKRRVASRPHILLQFQAQPQEKDYSELERRGVSVLEYVPENALLVSVPDERFLGGLPIASVRMVAPEEKISPLVTTPGAVARAAGIELPRTALIVTFHRDVEPGEARALIAEHGLTIREHLDLLPRALMVEATAADAASLAQWDEVAYVYAASDHLAAGRPVHACAGAATALGPVAAMAARVGDGWDGPGLGAARLGFYFGNLGRRLPRMSAQGEIRRAFDEWSRHVNVDFVPAAYPALPRTVAIEFAVRGHADGFPFDGPGRVLAHTFYPAPPNAETLAGDLHFDDDENWGVGTGIDLYSVALHELGHALGLGHSDRPGAVMYPYYARVTALTSDDIAAIRTLYAARGAPGGDDPEPPGPPLPPSDPKTDPKPEPGGPDSTAPALTVLSPSATSFSTYDESIAIRGSARDPGGVSEVTWTDSLGNTGLAQGTAVWTAGPVPLRVGTNSITIRARDMAGNVSWRSLSITRRRR